MTPAAERLIAAAESAPHCSVRQLAARRVAIETDEGVVIRADLDMSAAMATRLAYTLDLELEAT